MTGLSADIAIIGMGCLFPGAPNLDAYWQNILAGKDCVSDPPEDYWDVDALYQPDIVQSHSIYCKKGGYLGDLARVNPLEHKVMPKTLEGGEPDQWLALHVAKEALADAGYGEEIPEAARAAVIFGKGNYLNTGNLSLLQQGPFLAQTIEILRSLHPDLTEEDLARIRSDLKASLPVLDANTVPGLVPNISAGRLANRLDLMGPSYTVDAACASSLLATDLAVKGLVTGQIDMALVGGLHVALQTSISQMFCQLEAFSKSERIRPFDKGADGVVPGEGVGMLVLKRLEDAEREGRRIYAVIKGLGISSDGRGLSVLAPRIEGEIAAIRKAYESTGISPRSIGLLEAHGTATRVGDPTEINALTEVFGTDAISKWCAIGSVKSMIGHLMPAAGMAGLIKAALALYHNILPPTINVDDPIDELTSDRSPFYVNTATRPWIHDTSELPRRAGVDAFGFGGINAHAILEEYPEPVEKRQSRLGAWDSELCLLAAETRQGLLDRIGRVQEFLDLQNGVALKDVSYSLDLPSPTGTQRLAIVAESVDDLREKLKRSYEWLLDSEKAQISDRRGIYYTSQPLTAEGEVAFLLPGEGSQYVGMLADLIMHFPDLQQVFTLLDSIFTEHGLGVTPSRILFPEHVTGGSHVDGSQDWLWSMQGAISSVLVADTTMLFLFRRLGIEPSAICGHSTGEYPAMIGAGIIDALEFSRIRRFAVDLIRLYQAVSSDVELPPAALLAVAAGAEAVTEILSPLNAEIRIAMDNCPHQTVIVGDPGTIEKAKESLHSAGILTEQLPFSRPYHTPDFAAAAESMRPFFEVWITRSPRLRTYSCGTASFLPDDLAEIRRLAVEQWMRPVEFRKTIERMYEDGIRLFVEVGARGNLSAFTSDTLMDRPHLAVAANVQSRSSILQLQHALAQLYAHGVPMDLSYLFERRSPVSIDFSRPDLFGRAEPNGKTIRVSTSWPVMRLSEETIGLLRRRLGSQNAQLDPERRPDRVTPHQGAPTHASSSSRVVSNHLEAMNQFLSVQEDVMRAFLTGSSNGKIDQAPPPEVSIEDRYGAEASAGVDQLADSLPLVDEIITFKAGERVAVSRTLREDVDLFLRDHAFCRRVSKTHHDLYGLPVMPLTMSLELMAEAASLLAPGLKLTAIRNIEGRRWIVPDAGSLPLEIVAEWTTIDGEESIQTTIYDRIEGGAQAGLPRVPYVQAHMIFEPFYRPNPPSSISVDTELERPIRWSQPELYEHVLFHEDLFQGIESIEGVTETTARGRIRILPRTGLVSSTRAPRFILDPILLDQVGQIVGVWAVERAGEDTFYPFSLGRLDIFGRPLPDHKVVECRARIDERPEENLITAQIEVSDPEGKVILRCTDWGKRRIRMPNPVWAFFLNPGAATLVRVLEEGHDPASNNDPDIYWLDRRLVDNGLLSSAGRIWLSTMAFAILNHSERKEWSALQLVHADRTEWLIRRLAVKDAVRTYLESHYDLHVCPADVTLEVGTDGFIAPGGKWTDSLQDVPMAEIDDSDDAIVVRVGRRIAGIDWPQIQPSYIVKLLEQERHK